MAMVDENIEALRLENPDLQPPTIKVVAFSEANESSHGDEAFLGSMRSFRLGIPPNVSCHTVAV
jgi:hypothetical protein